MRSSSLVDRAIRLQQQSREEEFEPEGTQRQRGTKDSDSEGVSSSREAITKRSSYSTRGCMGTAQAKFSMAV